MSYTNVHSLTGFLVQGQIDIELKARADANGDHVLSVREIRTTLIDIIRGVLAGTEGYDINDDGSVSKADISATVASFRRLLLAQCGNGTVDAAEECDDGGTEDGDGCSAICVREGNYSCDGTPSVCTNLCGNGICASDETAAMVPGHVGAPYYCPEDCSSNPTCGNGVCETREGAYVCDPAPEAPHACDNYVFCPADCHL